MTDDEIQRRFYDFEDNWTERKPESVNRHDVRRTVVAFANSLAEGEEAILFIGITDNGLPQGVSNPDQKQKDIRDWLTACYPPIQHTSRVIQIGQKSIVAIIVTTDFSRPHFAGSSYVRIGSESVEATATVYEELIASRNTKARDLLRAKRSGELISLTRFFFGFDDHSMRHVLGDWEVITCTATLATFRQVNGGEIFKSEYSHLRLSSTPDGKQLRVDVDF